MEVASHVDNVELSRITREPHIVADGCNSVAEVQNLELTVVGQCDESTGSNADSACGEASTEHDVRVVSKRKA